MLKGHNNSLFCLFTSSLPYRCYYDCWSINKALVQFLRLSYRSLSVLLICWKLFWFRMRLVFLRCISLHYSCPSDVKKSNLISSITRLFSPPPVLSWQRCYVSGRNIIWFTYSFLPWCRYYGYSWNIIWFPWL